MLVMLLMLMLMLVRVLLKEHLEEKQRMEWKREIKKGMDALVTRREERVGALLLTSSVKPTLANGTEKIKK
jgi:hypothetical protein